jgi:hypothetical protein
MISVVEHGTSLNCAFYGVREALLSSFLHLDAVDLLLGIRYLFSNNSGRKAVPHRISVYMSGTSCKLLPALGIWHYWLSQDPS